MKDMKRLLKQIASSGSARLDQSTEGAGIVILKLRHLPFISFRR